MSLDKLVHEDKDKSVDNDANIDKSVGGGDKVVEEVEEVAGRQTVHVGGGGQKTSSDDDEAVEDTENGVHHHQQIQGTFASLLQDDADQVAIDQVDQHWRCP